MLDIWQLFPPEGQCHCHLSKAGGPGKEHTHQKQDEDHKVAMNSTQSGHQHQVELPKSISTLSLCSMNSAKFRRVWVTSAISWEVKANSMLRISSSCWSSFSSDQHETKAALKRSLGRNTKDSVKWGFMRKGPFDSHLLTQRKRAKKYTYIPTCQKWWLVFIKVTFMNSSFKKYRIGWYTTVIEMLYYHMLSKFLQTCWLQKSTAVYSTQSHFYSPW